MDAPALVAVSTEPSFFVPRLLRAWEGGEAILPLDHRLPVARARLLLDRFRPVRFEHPDGSEGLSEPGTIADDTFLVVPTSGTTGDPKGVQLSRGALAASARASESWLGTGPQRWLCCLPLAHIAGLSTVIRSHLAGSEAVVHDGFDERLIAEVAARKGAGAVSVVPTMLERLLDAGAPMDRFATVLVGGGPVPEDLLARARDMQVKVTATYGMTETCGGCIYDGWPLSGTEVRVERGEIQLKGPVVMTSYLGGGPQPFTDDKWLRTNDLGELTPQGRLRVHGRIDDIIITGGSKVAPVVVESALMSHNRIEDAAVVGLPDARWGERVVALIVAPQDPPTVEMLKAHLARSLPPYMIPKRFLLVAKVPRSSTGKIDRAASRLLAARLDTDQLGAAETS